MFAVMMQENWYPEDQNREILRHDFTLATCREIVRFRLAIFAPLCVRVEIGVWVGTALQVCRGGGVRN